MPKLLLFTVGDPNQNRQEVVLINPEDVSTVRYSGQAVTTGYLTVLLKNGETVSIPLDYIESFCSHFEIAYLDRVP